MPVTDQDRAAVRKLFRKVRLEVRPLVEAEAQRTGFHHPDTLNIMAAQNAIRACLEIILQDCLPYDQRFLAELSVRSAAYLVSAAPIEDHAAMLEVVAASLPGALAEKIRQGAVIRSTWSTDGREHANVPMPGDIS